MSSPGTPTRPAAGSQEARALATAIREATLSPEALGVAAAGAVLTREALALWRPWRLSGGTWIREDGRADSVQWVDLPDCPAWDLERLERLYFAWVPRLVASQVRPHWNDSDGSLRLAIEPLAWPPVIRMDPAELTSETRRRPIVGGWLATSGGSLDFELRTHGAGRRLVVAVRGLSPRLPLFLYLRIQTPLHERSTYAFLREMRRRCQRGLSASPTPRRLGLR